MTMTFGRNVHIISDTHFGHGSIIKYCKRPFMSHSENELSKAGVDFRVSEATVALHDKELIENINLKVKPHDFMIHLGDFSWWGQPKTYLARLAEYRNQIKCKNIYLVAGNHDRVDLLRDSGLFVEIFDLRRVSVGGHQIVLCHYPMRSWDRSHHGSWQLFGHVHGGMRIPKESLQLDMGVDSHNFMPWNITQIEQTMAPKIVAWEKYHSEVIPKEQGGMAPIKGGQS